MHLNLYWMMTVGNGKNEKLEAGMPAVTSQSNNTLLSPVWENYS